MLYGRKWHEYAPQWDTMTINVSRKKEFNKIAEYAYANRQRYLSIEGPTGVPWAMIACIHKRESDAQDKEGNPLFTSYLGNGQPLNRKTTIVPKGRGPFPSFEEGAVDALNYDKLTLVVEWRLEKVLFYLEAFNGPGYEMRGLPSAYIWGGTNIQKPGKFVSDGRWNGKALDGQPGCAPILWAIMQLDKSVNFKRED